jgi:hypothetical protein
MNAAALKMLADKGFSPQEMVEFAQLIESGPDRSKAAARQARYRQRQQENVTNDVTNDVTRNVTPPPKDNSNPHSVPDGTDGEPSDPVKQLFDLGVKLLKSQGHSEPKARSIIGSWRKGRSPGEVVAALVDAKTGAVSNLVEWMPKRLGRANGGQRDHADIVLEETARRAGAHH